MPGMPRPGGARRRRSRIAALVLFFLPGSSASVGGGGPGAAPSASAGRRDRRRPRRPTPARADAAGLHDQGRATRCPRSHGSSSITLDELLAANKDTIKNPDKIASGDEIVIPVPGCPRSVGARATPLRAVAASAEPAPLAGRDVDGRDPARPRPGTSRRCAGSARPAGRRGGPPRRCCPVSRISPGIIRRPASPRRNQPPTRSTPRSVCTLSPTCTRISVFSSISATAPSRSPALSFSKNSSIVSTAPMAGV